MGRIEGEPRGNWTPDNAQYNWATSHTKSTLASALQNLPDGTTLAGSDLIQIVAGHSEFQAGVRRYNAWVSTDGGRYYQARPPSEFLSRVRSISEVSKNEAPSAVAACIQLNFKRIL